MIVKRYWDNWNKRRNKICCYMGYFLFGFIPLYIEQIFPF